LLFKGEKMIGKASVFEKTYKDYIAQIAGLDFKSFELPLGVRAEGDGVLIPLFGEFYTISANGIANPCGKQPPLDVCVILCKYLLLCPTVTPHERDWVSYRDLRDSGPLTLYFLNDVERAIADHFTGRLDALNEAGKSLGGYPPNIQVSHDLSMQFDVLPRVPVILLFNDADDEFPARASVLFERRSESYLDPECLAMAGRLLFTHLRKAGWS
jgi:hypothetical protein